MPRFPRSPPGWPRRRCRDALQKRVGSNLAGDAAQLVVQMVAGGLHRVADGRLLTLLGGSSDGANCPVHGHHWRCSWAQRLRTILPGRQLRPTAVVTALGRRR
jgi:hypothetical protein